MISRNSAFQFILKSLKQYKNYNTVTSILQWCGAAGWATREDPTCFL